MRAFKHPQKRRFLRAFDLWAAAPSLGFEDALTVAYVEQQDVKLATFDTDFDGILGVIRSSPS